MEFTDDNSAAIFEAKLKAAIGGDGGENTPLRKTRISAFLAMLEHRLKA